MSAAPQQPGRLYRAQGRYAEAEPLYKRATAIPEKALGPDHPDVGRALNGLACSTQQRPLCRGRAALPARAGDPEKALGPEHPERQTLNNLADTVSLPGRHHAESLCHKGTRHHREGAGPRPSRCRRRAQPPGRAPFPEGLCRGRAALQRPALAIAEKALGPDHPDVGTSLNNLAGLYRAQGRYAEAEPLYQARPRHHREGAGPRPPRRRQLAQQPGRALPGPGPLCRGRAALQAQRSPSREKALGPDHPDVGTLAQQPGRALRAQGRYAEAEPLSKRALAINEKALGPDHPDVGTALNNLAELTGPRAATPRPSRSTSAPRHPREGAGPRPPRCGRSSLNNLAWLYRAQGRYAEAEPLYKRASPSREGAGPDHPDVGTALNNLAGLYFAQRDWARAADFWRRSTRRHRPPRPARHRRCRPGLTGKRKSEAEQLSYQFWGLVKVVHRLARTERGTRRRACCARCSRPRSGRRPRRRRARWRRWRRAGPRAIAALAALVRERQDLVAEWQKRDARAQRCRAQAPDKRDRASRGGQRRPGSPPSTRASPRSTSGWRASFPDYAALARPAAAVGRGGAGPARRRRGAGAVPRHARVEADAGGDLHLGGHQDGRALGALELGTHGARREVAALRCGLDEAEWATPIEGSERCAKRLQAEQIVRRRAPQPLPFDLGSAHALYRALFGQVEDLIKDKHLLIVPSAR